MAAKGIVWAADHGADVINMSFGGPMGLGAAGCDPATPRAKGVVVVGSAGNYGTTAAFYPGAYPR